MFDVSWSELLVIAAAALIFIGPKELPGVLRTVGQWTGKMRRMASEFQDQFREAMREAEVADLKKDIEASTANLGADLDPFKDLREATAWKPSDTTSTTPPASDAPPAPPAEAVVAEPSAPAEHPEAAPAAAEPAVPYSDEAPAATPSAGGGHAA
jgi:sec-independent protein translocase protein TatB